MVNEDRRTHDEGTDQPASPHDPAHERKKQEHEESRGYPEKSVDTGTERTKPPRGPDVPHREGS